MNLFWEIVGGFPTFGVLRLQLVFAYLQLGSLFLKTFNFQKSLHFPVFFILIITLASFHINVFSVTSSIIINYQWKFPVVKTQTPLMWVETCYPVSCISIKTARFRVNSFINSSIPNGNPPSDCTCLCPLPVQHLQEIFEIWIHTLHVTRFRLQNQKYALCWPHVKVRNKN